ncbi:MAG: N-6 DNA methylase [Paludibacter sp.]|nr:N-6 DNA methylase [Paludibacter sp.]
MVKTFLIQNIQPQVQTYLACLSARPDGEEIEYRTPFETLFNSLSLPFMQKTSIIQEDRRSGIEIDGMPDFFVWNDADTTFKSLIGFIECKKPAFNLEKLIDSEQIKKYSKTCENIIITNYHRFILLQKGKQIHDLELSSNPIVIQHFTNLLQDFYGYIYPYICTKKTLVSSLAAQSFYYSVALRQYVENKENETDGFYRKFNATFNEYQTSFNYYYGLADFCDIYSQSLVYGLLLARLNSQKDFDEKDLRYIDAIPLEYKLLREFLSQAYESGYLPTSIKIALTNIGKNVNLVNTDAIQTEFNKANNGKQNIAVYLYEDFLQQYDNLRNTEKRKSGGVYYTPQEATDFITRSVDDIIKTQFHFQKGYLSENIKVLDFACGTGTFLHSIFEIMLSEKTDELQKSLIKQKIVNDIYGFELLFTPYIIAHTFLTLYLKDKGIFLENNRLGIYLTNTLDIAKHTVTDFLPTLKNEHEKATQIKDQENILAIVGNPPYFNGKSFAKKGIIDKELEKYKTGLNERKINLDDDYIKFIRFAEWKITQNKMGIVGIITNNSYLDGVTHRQMRKHLYETFDEIYIVNLHGNTRKKEQDKNIFDIMVGVSIVFFVKHKNPAKKKIVKYFSTLENNLIKRQQKLDFLANNKLSDLKWKKLKPEHTEFFWFTDKDLSLGKEYNKFWKITDIFAHYNSGIETKKDEFTIQYTKKKIETIVEDFEKIPFYEVKSKYNLKDGHWTTKSAYKSLKEVSFDKKFIRQLQYRPFDNRWSYIHEIAGFLARPRYQTNKYFEHANIGLCFTRNLDKDYYSDILISDKPIDAHVTSGQNYIAPLYIYNGGHGYAEIDFDGHKRYANFTQNFIKKYLEKINFEPTPEEILAYIYAVLHSKIYREKYLEFLKTDFPAVPLTTDKEIFYKYAKLGQKLIDLHLLENLSDDVEIKVSSIPEKDFVVEKIIHDNNKLFLHTKQDKTVVFEGITSEVYNFEIGSYKPIEKWLKYRIKDKIELTVHDLKHLQKMIISIKNTILLMNKIEGLGEEYLK